MALRVEPITLGLPISCRLRCRRGAALHVEPAGKDAFVAQPVVDAIAHRLPDAPQAFADIGLAAPDAFVGQHQLGYPQVVALHSSNSSSALEKP